MAQKASFHNSQLFIYAISFTSLVVASTNIPAHAQYNILNPNCTPSQLLTTYKSSKAASHHTQKSLISVQLISKGEVLTLWHLLMWQDTDCWGRLGQHNSLPLSCGAMPKVVNARTNYIQFLCRMRVDMQFSEQLSPVSCLPKFSYGYAIVSISSIVTAVKLYTKLTAQKTEKLQRQLQKTVEN